MNYIRLINQFWQMRRSRHFTSLQADLYYFLLQESNARSWENPFQISNVQVCAGIGISEKSLIDARNLLVQVNLIEYTPGITKRKAPTYRIIDYCNKVSNEVSIQGGIPGGNGGSNQGGNEVYIIQNKLKENQTRVENAPGKWESKPGPEHAGMDLSPDEITLTIEFMFRMNKGDMKPNQVINKWIAFKVLNFNGQKYYASRGDCIQHFRNWLKDQKADVMNGLKVSEKQIIT
jgi:hypothetical protein